MAPIVVKRPMLSIQCDWEEVLSANDGTAWVSCKEVGSNSRHGKITSILEEPSGELKLQAEEGFRIENFSTKSLTLCHEDPNSKCTFFAATKVFSNIHSKSITSLDVTTKGLGVSVCSSNKLLVWDADNGSILYFQGTEYQGLNRWAVDSDDRTLEGHIWDVYSCQFFPSGLVVLSAGADLQIKIWSAETGQCPVTLKGHTAAITDTCIVDRGRNIISVAKDGTARLWDCGESHCLDIISRQEGAINCCSIADVNMDVGQADGPRSEREVATEGKLLILGCENGAFCGVGVRSRKQVFEYKHTAAVNCCCYLPNKQVLCGAQDGKIFCCDLTDTSEPCVIWEESASAVLCLLPVKDGFFAGRADGTCSYLPLNGDLTVQLTGPGFDPVYCIASDGNCIFTGCRDGLLRKYHLPDSVGISLC